MFGHEMGDWLWEKPTNPEQPQDLGYVIGARIVETFYLIGMILDDEYKPTGFGILPFTSTKINAYKESIGVIRTIPGNAPLYAFPLRVTTKPETHPKGTSFNFVLMPEGYEGNVFKDGLMTCFIAPDDERAESLYKAGKQLAVEFDSGAANIAYDTEGSHGGDGAGSEDEPY